MFFFHRLQPSEIKNFQIQQIIKTTNNSYYLISPCDSKYLTTQNQFKISMKQILAQIKNHNRTDFEITGSNNCIPLFQLMYAVVSSITLCTLNMVGYVDRIDDVVLMFLENEIDMKIETKNQICTSFIKLMSNSSFSNNNESGFKCIHICINNKEGHAQFHDPLMIMHCMKNLFGIDMTNFCFLIMDYMTKQIITNNNFMNTRINVCQQTGNYQFSNTLPSKMKETNELCETNKIEANSQENEKEQQKKETSLEKSPHEKELENEATYTIYDDNGNVIYIVEEKEEDDEDEDDYDPFSQNNATSTNSKTDSKIIQEQTQHLTNGITNDVDNQKEKPLDACLMRIQIQDFLKQSFDLYQTNETVQYIDQFLHDLNDSNDKLNVLKLNNGIDTGCIIVKQILDKMIIMGSVEELKSMIGILSLCFPTISSQHLILCFYKAQFNLYTICARMSYREKNGMEQTDPYDLEHLKRTISMCPLNNEVRNQLRLRHLHLFFDSINKKKCLEFELLYRGKHNLKPLVRYLREAPCKKIVNLSYYYEHQQMNALTLRRDHQTSSMSNKKNYNPNINNIRYWIRETSVIFESESTTGSIQKKRTHFEKSPLLRFNYPTQ